MSDPSEVLLFGSFTEDEARSWLNIAKKPEERKESQANSLNPGTELIFGSFNNLIELVGSPHKPLPSDSSDINKDNNKSNENGIFHSSNNLRNGNHKSIDGINFPALDAPAARTNLVYPFTISNFSREVHNKEANSKISVPLISDHDILPRGLIKSGNLCFFNATLQALLYCSPFVQLLQG